MIRVAVTGDDKAIANLEHVSHGVADLREPTKTALLYVHSQMPPYPSPSATSRYRRTGTLGRTITTFGSASGPALSRVEGSGSHVIGYVGSSLSYAPYVIDASSQAFMHRGRWWTLQSVVEKSRDGIRRIYESFVQKLVG